MSSQYKREEQNLKKIIKDNVTPRNDEILKINVFYKNSKLSQQFIRKNVHADVSNSYVVYKYNCNQQEQCQLSSQCLYKKNRLKKKFTLIIIIFISLE